jgi:EAL domain-containing protein (putative c-di-GMP-specific phosphodiesterase class I)
VDSGGQVKSCEALLRWTHSVRGRVPPFDFIPIAEEAGLIFELGRWVLETACAQLAAWAAHPLLRELHIAVNVSTRQFLDANFVEIVKTVVRETGANPLKLRIEITESAMVENVEEIIVKMGRLKDLGIGLSLDDFGTGYSSLSYLRRMPLDQLKIDRSFVKNVVRDTKDAAVASTIIALGRSLGFSVIAEGVETEEQMSFLKNEGCHIYQGFLYSPALSAFMFEEFVWKRC